MAIIDAKKKGAKTIIDEINTPGSFKIGEAFENYTREELFPKELFELVHKTAKYTDNKEDFQRETLKPDFLFKDKRTGKEFYVECKFRSKKEEDDNALHEICKDYQIKRYKELNKEKPVFIVLGFYVKFDGEKLKAKEISDLIYDEGVAFLIPVEILADNYFDLNNGIDHIISTRHPVSSKMLWNYFAKSENFLGYCIRCGKRIPENMDSPYCYDCFKSWNKFKNPTFSEKTCHKCGKSNKSTMEKPICKTCYNMYFYL